MVSHSPNKILTHRFGLLNKNAQQNYQIVNTGVFHNVIILIMIITFVKKKFKLLWIVNHSFTVLCYVATSKKEFKCDHQCDYVFQIVSINAN
jgi:hypothetical protein